MNNEVNIKIRNKINKKMINIERAKIEDKDQILDFFNLVLTDTFKKNNIFDLKETFDEEVKDKRKYLNDDFASNGEKRLFLIAKINKEIVGSIEFGPSNELIHECTKGELDGLMEVGTVFVHQDFQGLGIGSVMINAIIEELKAKGFKEYCFDSGYETAQKIWKKKYGQAQYHLVDFWGEGADHMVWKIKIS